MTRKTRDDRVRENLLRNKEAVRRLVTHGALNWDHEIAHIQLLLRQIISDREYLRSLEKEKDVLQSYEDFTSWGHGSEDGDWVFMTMREDELRNIKERQRRIQRRERRLKK